MAVLRLFPQKGSFDCMAVDLDAKLFMQLFMMKCCVAICLICNQHNVSFDDS